MCAHSVLLCSTSLHNLMYIDNLMLSLEWPKWVTAIINNLSVGFIYCNYSGCSNFHIYNVNVLALCFCGVHGLNDRLVSSPIDNACAEGLCTGQEYHRATCVCATAHCCILWEAFEQDGQIPVCWTQWKFTCSTWWCRSRSTFMLWFVMSIGTASWLTKLHGAFSGGGGCFPTAATESLHLFCLPLTKTPYKHQITLNHIIVQTIKPLMSSDQTAFEKLCYGKWLLWVNS